MIFTCNTCELSFRDKDEVLDIIITNKEVLPSPVLKDDSPEVSAQRIQNQLTWIDEHTPRKFGEEVSVVTHNDIKYVVIYRPLDFVKEISFDKVKEYKCPQCSKTFMRQTIK